jgi:hypothetical protein
LTEAAFCAQPVVLGGEGALASYLGITKLRLALYLNGTALCPTNVSRKVVRLLLAEDLQRPEGATPPAHSSA